MPSRTILSLAAAAALATAPTYVNAQILSCADVGCPGGNTLECKVADKTLGTLGVAPISSDNKALSGLSWVGGVAIKDEPEKDREFDENFYLATPPDFNLTRTGGCALFFHRISDSVKFADTDPESFNGTCQDALGSQCVSALIKRAEEFDFADLSGEDACDALHSEFTNNMDQACAGAAIGSNWAGVGSKPILGDDASEPISGNQNSSSTCWPIQPKSNDLTLIESVKSTGDDNVETYTKHALKITPILTVFFPEGNGASVSQVDAQLTCMKPQEETEASRNSQSDGNGDSGAATLTAGAGIFAAIVGALVAFLL